MDALPEGTPIWVAIIILVLLNFRSEISKYFDRRGQSSVDIREHYQELELKERTASLLQRSWQEDKLASLLEENESFIREIVHQDLRTIIDRIQLIEFSLDKVRATLDDYVSITFSMEKRLRQLLEKSKPDLEE